jgi:hypothetical protein
MRGKQGYYVALPLWRAVVTTSFDQWSLFLVAFHEHCAQGAFRHYVILNEAKNPRCFTFDPS